MGRVEVGLARGWGRGTWFRSYTFGAVAPPTEEDEELGRGTWDVGFIQERCRCIWTCLGGDDE